MPSTPNPMQNHQLYLTTQAMNMEKKVVEAVEMVWTDIMRPPPSPLLTKNNWKLYESRIDNEEIT
ncbi:hypothetical protein C1H46_030628 [Malus baccata]|uniref:Uncharacterized protein n=1 Tax=Malus baccata TaxID=106549 RepID=A0A540LBF8_MALBA|nr:hypothetical protein C1H46_030628 [Malus baccata]